MPFTLTGSQPPPPFVINSWGPTSGPAGTVVTINGTGLASTKQVWVGAGHDGKVISATDTTLQIQVPTDASTGHIAISNGTSWRFTGGMLSVVP